ncbi:MAG TPA: ABC transporter ATP-binding protein, partial [Chthoniobacterales bacterium]
MASLTLRNLSKTYGQVAALQDVSFEVREGEFFVLLGPTGAGKTTALRCIAGLEKPERGDIKIGDDLVNDWSAAQRDVALVFQQYSLYPNYTVRQNLEFPLRSKLRRTPWADITRRVHKAAETVRITHLLDRRTDRLSGGEMQRVSIGRAIVREPRLFLMDEPLSNLDAKLREVLRAELQELQLHLGTTLIFVTHDQVEALTMGNRLGILQDGRLVQVGSPYDVYNKPLNTFVASFVGTPAINLFEAAIGTEKLVVVAEHFEFPLDAATRSRLGGLAGARDRVRVGVRPEHVKLVDTDGIPGTVYGAEDHGVEKIVTVRVADHLIRATVPSTIAVALDQPVRIAFEPEQLHFFDHQT